MEKSTLFLLVLFVITGCASNVKSRVELSDSFKVTTFDKKTKNFIDKVAVVEKIEDKNGNYFLSLKTDFGRNTFSANHVDEYLYYIDQYLASEEEEIADLGIAHSFSSSQRLFFSKIFIDKPLLGINNCLFAECDVGSVLYYENATLENLRRYIINFGDKSSNEVIKYKPQPTQEGKSTIYLYRNNTKPTAVKAGILLNEMPLAKLASKGCVSTSVDSGSITLQVEGKGLSGIKARSIELSVEQNENYFIQYSSDTDKNPDKAISAMLNLYIDTKPFRVMPKAVAVNDIIECEMVEIEE